MLARYQASTLLMGGFRNTFKVQVKVLILYRASLKHFHNCKAYLYASPEEKRLGLKGAIQRQEKLDSISLLPAANCSCN